MSDETKGYRARINTGIDKRTFTTTEDTQLTPEERKKINENYISIQSIFLKMLEDEHPNIQQFLEDEQVNNVPIEAKIDLYIKQFADIFEAHKNDYFLCNKLKSLNLPKNINEIDRLPAEKQNEVSQVIKYMVDLFKKS